MSYLLLLCLLLGSASANQYAKLNNQITTRSKTDLVKFRKEDVPRKIRQLRDVLSPVIRESLLAQDSAKVTRNVRLVQGAYSLSQVRPESTNLPFALIRDGQAIVAFTILYGGEAVPGTATFVQLYRKSGKSWSLEAQQEVFPNSGVTVEPLSDPHGLMLLCWGKRFGDTGARADAAVLSAENKSLDTVWSVSSIENGSIRLRNDIITVESMSRSGIASEKQFHLLNGAIRPSTPE